MLEDVLFLAVKSLLKKRALMEQLLNHDDVVLRQPPLQPAPEGRSDAAVDARIHDLGDSVLNSNAKP
jgi:hypothetical protein